MTPRLVLRKQSEGGLARAASQSAFSLLELLISLIVIVGLAVLTSGQFTASARKKARDGCLHNLQTIYVATGFFKNDNKDAYPFVKDAESSEVPLSLLIPKDTTETAIFLCPASGDKTLPEGESFAKRRISYAYYMGRTAADGAEAPLLSDRQVNTLLKRAGVPLFSADGKKPANNHQKYGGNVLACDGSAAWSGPATSRDLLFPTNVILLNPRP